MEHRDAQALLELAAVEPHGFERLAAGDTTEAAALAGHLAGCESCAAEFEHLGSLAPEIRAAVRELPPADLRERTLALVASTGRARMPDVGAAADESAAVDLDIEPTVPAAAAPIPVEPRTRAGVPRSWALATAASLVIAVAGLAGWRSATSDLEHEQAAMARLAQVTETTARISALPDAATVALSGAPTGATTPSGEVVISPASHELVVLAEGLAPPESGTEYRWWVEVGGVREAIGTLSFYGGLATWAGWSGALERIRPGARFGVSLVESDLQETGQQLLSGEL